MSSMGEAGVGGPVRMSRKSSPRKRARRRGGRRGIFEGGRWVWCGGCDLVGMY